MNKKGYVDSFVAFIDILGFKNYIKAAILKMWMIYLKA